MKSKSKLRNCFKIKKTKALTAEKGIGTTDISYVTGLNQNLSYVTVYKKQLTSGKGIGTTDISYVIGLKSKSKLRNCI